MPARSRREESLSRDRLVDAAIELLDEGGEGGLTFRTLSERLATGPGAIYGHIANKSDLLTAACDAVVARTVAAQAPGDTPEARVRMLALGMFDAIDAHPWVGAALVRSAGQLPAIRLLEGLGQPLQALGVPAAAQWPAVSALLHYILGVAGQNATNAQLAQTLDADRADFLQAVSNAWLQLDAQTYPFTRSVAASLRAHDDRADFLAGIDLILAGIAHQTGR